MYQSNSSELALELYSIEAVISHQGQLYTWGLVENIIVKEATDRSGASVSSLPPPLLGNPWPGMFTRQQKQLLQHAVLPRAALFKSPRCSSP